MSSPLNTQSSNLPSPAFDCPCKLTSHPSPSSFQGAVLFVSHDSHFVEEVGHLDQSIDMGEVLLGSGDQFAS